MTAAAGFRFCAGAVRWRSIGLSSGVPTAPFLATGWLGDKQCAALSAMLEALKGENLFRVVLIHHPPVSEAPRHKRLIDAAAFMQVIAAHGAELVLHGHDHVHMINWLQGPGGRQCRRSACRRLRPRTGHEKDAAAYNLYAIDGAPGAWQCEMISRGIGDDGEVAEEKRTMLAGN